MLISNSKRIANEHAIAWQEYAVKYFVIPEINGVTLSEAVFEDQSKMK